MSGGTPRQAGLPPHSPPDWREQTQNVSRGAYFRWVSRGLSERGKAFYGTLQSSKARPRWQRRGNSSMTLAVPEPQGARAQHGYNVHLAPPVR